MLTSGTSISWSLGRRRGQYTRKGRNLLGNERVDLAHCWVLRDQRIPLDHTSPHRICVARVWDRPYLENFTVDASIFVVTTSY